MSSSESFLIVWLLLWVLGSSSCLVFSELLASTTPFLPAYWCSLRLIQGILLRFCSSRAYRWALTSAIFGVSLFGLLPLVLGGLLHRVPTSNFFLFSPSLALMGWLIFVHFPSIGTGFSSSGYDILPLAWNSAIFFSLFMFAGGAFLGYIQQRALGIRFRWWWLLASGLVWAVGTVVFLMGAFIFDKDSVFFNGYAWILALLISGATGSFIKGVSLLFLFNRERSRNLYE